MRFAEKLLMRMYGNVQKGEGLMNREEARKRATELHLPSTDSVFPNTTGGMRVFTALQGRAWQPCSHRQSDSVQHLTKNF